VSPLQTLFLSHPGPDDSVTIILQDVGHEDVGRVLEFVYTGAAVVPGHRMDGFVTAAGALGIGPLLDPRRHLEMSSVQPPASHCHPCSPATVVNDPTPLTTTPPQQQHPYCRVRQPPRTTGILTPSPWTQNSRPPCATPRYSAPKTVQPDSLVIPVHPPTANPIQVSYNITCYHFRAFLNTTALKYYNSYCRFRNFTYVSNMLFILHYEIFMDPRLKKFKHKTPRYYKYL
jgi:hypothetical protein